MLSVPYGCETIKSKAFASCSDLLYVWIPNSVISVAGDAFEADDLAVLDYVGSEE